MPSTPSYAQFVAAYRTRRAAKTVDGERVAVPAPDWIDLAAGAFAAAVMAVLRLPARHTPRQRR